MGRSEALILQDVLVEVSHLPQTMVWRNNTGRLPDRYGRLVSFGLDGSADVIGVHRGYPIAIETKRERNGRQSKKQQIFQAAGEKARGVYILANSVDQVLLRTLAALP